LSWNPNEYYPYGLQTTSSWTREGNSNNFLYNGGTEQNTTTGPYDLAFRNFDPALDRFHQVDPMASKYSALIPYSYANGNPASFNDPSGLESYSPQGGCNACVFARTFKDANYDADITPNGGPMFNPRFSGTNAQAIENFITQTLKGYGFGYGGSWNNGSVTMYATDEQALMAGYAYNDLHQSWANTALFGGLAGGDNLSGSISGDYKGISGTFKNVGFIDGSIGIHEKFVPFTNDEPWPNRTWQVLHSAFDSFDWDWAMETEQSANHYKQTSVIIIYNNKSEDVGTANYGKVLWLIRKTREFSMRADGFSTPKEIHYDPSDQMVDFIETSIEYHRGSDKPTVWDIYWNFVLSSPKKNT